MSARRSWAWALPVALLGCGGASDTRDGGPKEDAAVEAAPMHHDAGSPDSGSHRDAGTDARGGTDSGGKDAPADTGAPDNVAPIVVNQGLAGSQSIDVPYVSVTVCQPGTTKCVTVDNLILDTGSSGLRVVASALAGLDLPQAMASTGDPLVECGQFGAGFTWGSVRLVDVKIGGEVAANIPMQYIGDPAFATIPKACSSAGPENDSAAAIGANGLLGINQIVADCGAYCSGAHPVPGAYYSCGTGACTVVAVDAASQVGNPIAAFPKDNNGALLTFPSVPAGGAVLLAGRLVFGIGTASNNALGGAEVLTLDDFGNFTTVFNGKTLSGSYVDSGTNVLSFNDSSLTGCTGELSGLYCPASPTSLSAENEGQSGATSTVSFTVEDAKTLFSASSNTAFDDLASRGMAGSFAWGFPFFIGRTVFVGLQGAKTPGGSGPFVAY